MRTFHERSSLILFAMLLGAACAEEPAPAPEPEPEAEEVVEEIPDAGVDAGQDAGPPRPPARIFARRFVSKVRERPDRDSFRIGYLRAGAVVQATTGHPVRTGDTRCRGGWYELTTGGFVCNGSDVIAFWGRRLPQVPGTQADRDAPLPYDYARTVREGTPMYRGLPSDEEAAEFEGFRIPGQEPPPAPEGEAGDATALPSTGDAPAVAGEGETPEAPAQEAPAAPSPAAAAPEAEEEEEEEPVTLASLQGERGTILLRRLVRGFIVSLDRDFRAGDFRRRYWRTINNGFVPYRSVTGVSVPDSMGMRLDELVNLPVGFITSRSDAWYRRGDDGRARRGGALDFHDSLDIVSEETLGSTEYFVGSDGRYYRQQDVRTLRAAPRPDEVGPNEKWIEVNLEEQYVIAYEGDRPVFATLTSTGRPFVPDDPEADYLTPTGTFRIRAKHLASTMDGDTAADGPYSIDDVPYVMYFELAYALHAAFWHRGFGYPRSHGCVNLAPRDAQWMFNWSDPQVPFGWHGAYPTEDNPGTLIWVHGRTPGQRD